MTILVKCKLPKQNFEYIQMLEDETINDMLQYLHSKRNLQIDNNNIQIFDDKENKFTDFSKTIKELYSNDKTAFITINNLFASAEPTTKSTTNISQVEENKEIDAEFSKLKPSQKSFITTNSKKYNVPKPEVIEIFLKNDKSTEKTIAELKARTA